jgi:hypothetical protein
MNSVGVGSTITISEMVKKFQNVGYMGMVKDAEFKTYKMSKCTYIVIHG